MIDLRPPSEVAALVERVTSFIEETVAPMELAQKGSLHAAPESLRFTLQAAARDAGVFAPHVPVALGGLGIDQCGRAPVFEAAGRSLFGPLALNAAAPDEGNIHLLDVVANAEQRVRYLIPLARGDVRSCFAMTEPAPGAGSDPSMLRTTARRSQSGWVLNGRKWFTTGAVGSSFAIVMARTSGEPGDRGGATMFLVDSDAPGLAIRRTIGTLDHAMIGGHAEVELVDCEVPHDAVLGDVDLGFRNAQVRLGPARLSHCMRWLGLATKAQEIGIRRASEREAFGQRLGELGMVQQMLADSTIDIAASRGLIVAAASELDRGESAAQSTSIAKVFVAEAVGRVIDRAVQICGALGTAEDSLLSAYFREVRAFRIYDGPSETHRWAIASRLSRAFERSANTAVVSEPERNH